MTRLLIAGLMVQVTAASARSHRQMQIPNGDALQCVICHPGNAFGDRTAFGAQVELFLQGDRAAADVDWPSVAALDADGDGHSNGAELGDPDGTWVPGDPDPGVRSDVNNALSTPDNTARPGGLTPDAGPPPDVEEADDQGGCQSTPGGGPWSLLWLTTLGRGRSGWRRWRSRTPGRRDRRSPR